MAPLPRFAMGTEASDLINFISEKRGVVSGNYLEIGVEHGRTFEAVRFANRFAVDPSPLFSLFFRFPSIRVFSCTSNEFFRIVGDSFFFDLVFLDGLHTAEQTFEDLRNVSKLLTKDSIIIIDDTVPLDKWSAIPNQELAIRSRQSNSSSTSGAWQGDVYRLVLTLADLKIEHLHFVTLFGMANPKTILWTTDPAAWVALSKLSNSRLVESQDFDTLERDYLKSLSNPMDLDYFKANFETVTRSNEPAI